MPVNIKTVRKTDPKPPTLRTAPLYTSVSAQTLPSPRATSTDGHAVQISKPQTRPPLVRPAAFPSLEQGETIGQRWEKLPEDDIYRILMERLFPDEVVGGPNASTERVKDMYRSPEKHDLEPYQRHWYKSWRKFLESEGARHVRYNTEMDEVCYHDSSGNPHIRFLD